MQRKSISGLHRSYYGMLSSKEEVGKGKDLGNLGRNKCRKIKG